MQTKILKTFIIATVIFLISGCAITFKTGNQQNNDLGGIFKTINRGEVWAQKGYVPTLAEKPLSMASLDSSMFRIDPSDPKAFYFGSAEGGLYYSWNNGDTWNSIQSLGKILVSDFAVDPKNKCILYAASGHKLYKSIDCARTWNQVFQHNNTQVSVSSAAIDYYNSQNIFIGTITGDILKSSDGGESWQLNYNANDKVMKIAFSPSDSRIIFIATAKKSLLRTMDAGASWENLKEALKDYSDSLNFRDLALPSGQTVFLAGKTTLLKSDDNGSAWSEIKLLTTEKDTSINAIAINPGSMNEIYYVTNTTFYQSLDGGQNWSTKKLPTSRAGSQLILSPSDPATLFMTAKTIKK